MKKNMPKIGLVSALVGLFVMVTTSTFAATVCSDMKIVKTGTKVIGGAQVNVVRAKRASAATCGNMTTADIRTFNFSATNGDAGLATALTALSLGQNVYMVLTSDTAAAGTTVEIIQISAP